MVSWHWDMPVNVSYRPRTGEIDSGPGLNLSNHSVIVGFQLFIMYCYSEKKYILIQSALKIFISLEYIVSVVMYGNFNSFSISGK